METIKIQNLSNEFTEELKAKIRTKSESDDKTLMFDLDNADVGIDPAWEIARAVHSSNIQLFTICRGKLSAGALILASCGMPDHRQASLATSFVLNDQQPEKLGSFRKVDNPNEDLLKFILGKFSGKKRVLNELLKTRNLISSVDAFSGRLIDKIDDFENRYQAEIKKEKAEAKKTHVESEVRA